MRLALVTVALVATACTGRPAGPGPESEAAAPPRPAGRDAAPEQGSASGPAAPFEPPTGPGAGSLGADDLAVEELALRGPDGAPARAILAFPAAARGAEEVPAVVALHGRGESLRGPEAGARGWLEDYALGAAFAALRRGRLEAGDYRGFVDPARLEAVNAILGRAPLRPLAVVTPYLPDLAREPPGSPALCRYGDWLAGPLLEAARERLPGLARSREALGVDGVSLGGMVALEAGFARPEVFGRVGGIQPAVTGREEALALAAARPGAPRPRVRLLTSLGDPFLGPTRRLAAALRARGLEVELVVLPGPHDYEFNRGPGSLELLLFHGPSASLEESSPPRA